MFAERVDDLVGRDLGMQGFRSDNLLSDDLDRKPCTGINRLSVNEDRTGSTTRPIANILAAGQIQIVAERIDQQDTRLNRHLFVFAIHIQSDGLRSG